MRILAIILLSFVALAGCEAVKFRQVALYDRYEEPPVNKAASTLWIYEDGAGTMWSSLGACGDFGISNEAAYSGKSSIKISWDKGKGCEWIGFGNSFSNWAAADMSEERLRKALSFQVRTQSKTARSVPIVASLEDMADGGSYHFCDAGKYLNGLEIDTNWKEMIVPLWDFPIREDEVDIYAIKQMKFQLEGAGSFFIDDIKLIDYTKEEYAAQREAVEEMKPKGTVEQTVYREGQFEFDAWGQDDNRCQTLEERSSDGGKHIHWQFNPKDCAWAKWGLNWTDWYQANWRGIEDKAKITFRYKTDGRAQFRIKLEDYRYHSTEVFSTSSRAKPAPGWQTVEIPLSQLGLKEKGFAMDQIKQLLFEGVGAGEVQFDDISITGI
ncbi:MAG: hypothetical protein AAGN35_23645 [Bacteroidota bacterium]